jgi:hypothetical protein
LPEGSTAIEKLTAEREGDPESAVGAPAAFMMNASTVKASAAYRRLLPGGEARSPRNTESSGREGRSRERGERTGCLVDGEAIQLSVVCLRGEQKLIVHGCEA